MEFDPRPSQQKEEFPFSSSCSLSVEVRDDLHCRVLSHASGNSVTLKDVSPDRMIVEASGNIPLKPFLFDSCRYDEGAEEVLIQELSRLLEAAPVAIDLSMESLQGGKVSPVALALQEFEKSQPTQSLLHRVNELEKRPCSNRQKLVLQRLKRELSEHYDKEYGAQVRQYIGADLIDEIGSEDLYTTAIHYTSVEDLALMFKKASVIPLYNMDDPKALERALMDLQSFQEASEPRLFHDAFFVRLASALHSVQEEVKEEKESPGLFGGGIFRPDDDFID